MLKRIFIIIILVVLGLAAYLWKNGKLNQEGITEFAETVKNADAQDWKDAASRAGDKFVEVSKTAYEKGLSLKEEFEKMDWDELKDSMGLSESDLNDYKESLGFVFAEEETSAGDDEPVVDDQQDSVQVKEEKSPRSPVVSKKPSEKIKVKPAPVKKEPVPKYYAKAKATLAKAKEENKKGLPGKPNHLRHLRVAVKHYQQSLGEFQTSLKRDKLTSDQKQEIESILPNIQKQIYWGKKLDRI